MKLTRFECNVISGERVEIDQTAYRNDEWEIVVIDSIEKTPEGFYVFDPKEEGLTDKLG